MVCAVILEQFQVSKLCVRNCNFSPLTKGTLDTINLHIISKRNVSAKAKVVNTIQEGERFRRQRLRFSTVTSLRKSSTRHNTPREGGHPNSLEQSRIVGREACQFTDVSRITSCLERLEGQLFILSVSVSHLFTHQRSRTSSRSCSMVEIYITRDGVETEMC